MHIGMFSSYYPPHPGGVEIVVENLVRRLASRHQVTLVTAAWNGDAGVRDERGVTVHRLPTIHTTETWGVPYPVPTGRGIRAALESVRSADIFHAHGALYASSLLAAHAAKRARRPLVLTEHVGFVMYRQAIINGVERVAWNTVGNHVIRAAAAVATINSRVQDWLEVRYPEQPIRYIGNGVNTEAFRPHSDSERSALRKLLGLPETGILVLFAGRQSEKKNLDVLLRLPRRGFHLVVCGAKRGLREDGVTDLGIVPYRDMPGLFGCVDLMVNPSTGEGFPLAVQEAIAAGLPLVLLWDTGYGGWLDRNVVAACDSIQQLGPMLNMLVESPEARNQLARRERAWATSRWSWNATVASYEALYGEAMDGSVPREPATLPSSISRRAAEFAALISRR